MELYKIDPAEFSRYLRNKCQSSVTVNKEKVKEKEWDVLTIQGVMIKEIEEALIKRYKVP